MRTLGNRILVGALLLGATHCAGSRPRPDARPVAAADAATDSATGGTQAPAAAAPSGVADLSLATWGGKTTTLKALSGPVTMLFLWSTDCKSCLRKLAQMQELQRRSASEDGLRVVLVNTDPADRQAVAKDLAAPLGLSLPMTVDDRHQLRCHLRQRFGAEFFPHTSEAGPRVDNVPLPLIAVLGPGDKIWGEVSNNDSQTDDAFIAEKQYLITLAKRGEMPEKKPALNVRGEANLDNGLQLVFPVMTDEQIDQELPKVEAQILQAYPRLPSAQRQRMLHQAVDTMRRGGRVLLVP
jgi:hypothetical protein